MNSENTELSPVYVFPIHIGISDEDFMLGLGSIVAENSRLKKEIIFLD